MQKKDILQEYINLRPSFQPDPLMPAVNLAVDFSEFVQQPLPQDMMQRTEHFEIVFEPPDDSNNEKDKDLYKNDIFKMNAFASPTQNLTGLQEMCRSCRTTSEESHDADLHNLVRKLVFVALEGNYQQEYVPSHYLKQEIKFSDDEISKMVDEVASGLLCVDRSNVLQYLQMNRTCQELISQRRCFTQAHLRLDKICQKESQQINSAQVSVYFAALTGNVAYLYQAIYLLLSQASDSLGNEVFCNSIQAKIKSPIVFMTNSHDADLDSDEPMWTDKSNVIYNTVDNQTLRESAYDFKTHTVGRSRSEIKLQRQGRLQFVCVYYNQYGQKFVLEHFDTGTYQSGGQPLPINQKFITDATAHLRIWFWKNMIFAIIIDKPQEVCFEGVKSTKTRIVTLMTNDKKSYIHYEHLIDVKVQSLRVIYGYALLLSEDGILSVFEPFNGAFTLKRPDDKDLPTQFNLQSHTDNKQDAVSIDLPQYSSPIAVSFGQHWFEWSQGDFVEPVLLLGDKKQGTCSWSNDVGTWSLENEQFTIIRGGSPHTYNLIDGFLKPIISTKGKFCTIESKPTVKILEQQILVTMQSLTHFSVIKLQFQKQQPLKFYLFQDKRGWKPITDYSTDYQGTTLTIFMPVLWTSAILIHCCDEKQSDVTATLHYFQEEKQMQNQPRVNLHVYAKQDLEFDDILVSINKVHGVQTLSKYYAPKIQTEETQNQIRDFYMHDTSTKKHISNKLWALFLAQIVHNQSTIQGVKSTELFKENPISWLHLFPSKFYMEQLNLLLTVVDSQTLDLLSQNICDNFNMAMLREMPLQRDQPAVRICEISPKMASAMMRHSIILRKQILFAESIIDLPKEHQQIALRNLFYNILTGSTEQFTKTVKSFIQHKRYADIYPLVCALTLIEKLPFDTRQCLKNLLKQDDLPENLQILTKQVFLKKVVARYLKAKEINRAKNYDEKGYKVIQSELLSGGIKPENLDLSQKSKQYIARCAEICDDDLLHPVEVNQQTNVFTAIITQGQNPFVDEVIVLLQKLLVTSRNMQATRGGEAGMQLTRAAFAVMLKLNRDFEGIEDLIEQIQLREDEIPVESGPERDEVLKEICVDHHVFSVLQNVWLQAVQMRTWYSIKKQSVSNKFQHLDGQDRELNEEEHLNIVVKNVVEKASFLIKLEPSQTQTKDTEITKISSLLRKPSYTASHGSLASFPADSARLELQLEKLRKEHQQAQFASVLACLQSPVLASEIRDQVDNNYKAAIRRFTGLYFLDQTITPHFTLGAQCLQELQSNKLTHYLDGVGCNQQMEQKIRSVFCSILSKICQRLEQTTDLTEAKILLEALQWQYQARDFEVLQNKLNIFQLVSGRSAQGSLLEREWNSTYQRLDLLDVFKELFMTVLARITDSSTSSHTKLKIFGDQAVVQQVPSLFKMKSVVDEGASSLLIDSALRVIFRRLDLILTKNHRIGQINDSRILKVYEDNQDEESDGNTVTQRILDGTYVPEAEKFEFIDFPRPVVTIDNFQDLFEGGERIELVTDLFAKYINNRNDEYLPEQLYANIVFTDGIFLPQHPHPFKLVKKEDKCLAHAGNCPQQSQSHLHCTKCEFALSYEQAQIDYIVDQHCQQYHSQHAFFRMSPHQQVQWMPQSVLRQVFLSDVIKLDHQHSFLRNQDQYHDYECSKLNTVCRYEGHKLNSSETPYWQCEECHINLCEGCCKVGLYALQSKKTIIDCTKEPFSIAKFKNTLSRMDQILCAPKIHVQNITLASTELVPSHKHELKLQQCTAQCSLLAGALYCQSNSPARYSCDQCNFWLCDGCLKIDKFLLQTEPMNKEDSSKIIVAMQRRFRNKSEHLVTELVNCVKLLTSVSLGSQKAEAILQRVASQCYIETLLQLLPLVKEANKLTILKIFEELHSLNLLQVDEVQSSLYSYAKQCYLKHEFANVQVTITTLQKIDTIKPQIPISQMFAVDQVLWLWLCGGSLLNLMLGDTVYERNADVPQDYVVSESHKVLYCEATNSFTQIKKKDLVTKHSSLSYTIPDLKQIFMAGTTVVRVMILNILNRMDRYASPKLQPVLCSIVTSEKPSPKYASKNKLNMALLSQAHDLKRRSIVKQLFREESYPDMPAESESDHDAQSNKEPSEKPEKTLKQKKQDRLRENLDQDYHPTVFKQVDFKPLFKLHVQHFESQDEQVEAKETISASTTLKRKAMQLLLKTYTGSDENVLWNLKEYYLTCKMHNFIHKVKHTHITRQWMQLLDRNESFKDTYISKALKKMHFEVQERKTNVRNLIQLRLISRLHKSDLLVDTILLQLNNFKDRTLLPLIRPLVHFITFARIDTELLAKFKAVSKQCKRRDENDTINQYEYAAQMEINSTIFTDEKVVSLMQRHFIDTAVVETEMNVWIKCEDREVKVRQDSKIMMYISSEPGFNEKTRSLFIDKTHFVAAVDGYIMFCSEPMVCVYIDSCTYANAIQISQPQFYCNKYIADGTKLYATLRNDTEVTFKSISGFEGTVLDMKPMSGCDLLVVQQDAQKVLYFVADEVAKSFYQGSFDQICALKESVYITRDQKYFEISLQGVETEIECGLKSKHLVVSGEFVVLVTEDDQIMTLKQQVRYFDEHKHFTVHDGFIFGVEHSDKVFMIKNMKTHYFEKEFKVTGVKQVCNNLVILTDKGKEFVYLDSKTRSLQNIMEKTLDLPGYETGNNHLQFCKISQLANTVKFAFISPETPVQLAAYDQENVDLCIQFLQSRLRELKFSKLKSALIKHADKQIADLLNLQDLEGHRADLVHLVLTANQHLLDSRYWLLVMAHDHKYTSMAPYVQYTERFAIPLILQTIQYYVQKRLRVSSGGEETLIFNRLLPKMTIFDQLFSQVYNKSTKMFRKSSDDAKPFRVRFIGENAYDAGGPFRDVMENISQEITDRFLQPTSNMQTTPDVTSYQPRLLTSTIDLKRFHLIGKLIGWAIQQTVFTLSLDLNVIFWKKLCDIEISLQDLKSVDSFRYEVIQLILQGQQESMFEADLGDGVEEELCAGGSQIPVTAENRELFAALYLKKYLAKDAIIYDVIIKGIREVASPEILRLLTPQSGSLIAFSSPKINVETVIKQLRFDNTPNELKKMFKQMMRDFSNRELQMLIKFITGSARIAPSRIISIQFEDRLGYPVGHTCGESVDLPNYQSLDDMKRHFLTAITSCGEIDDDGVYGDYGEDDYGSDQDDSNEDGEGEESSERPRTEYSESRPTSEASESASWASYLSDDYRSQHDYVSNQSYQRSESAYQRYYTDGYGSENDDDDQGEGNEEESEEDAGSVEDY